MRTLFLTAVMVSVGLPSAGAQGFAEGWEFDGEAQAVLAISSMDDVERLPARSVLGEVSIRSTAKKTLENSAQIGLRLEVKAQQDNPARAGFTGNIEPFAPVIAQPSLRGTFSGLTRSGPVEDASLTGAVETAQIYIDGGYGQLSAGIGRGVAARFHEGAPDIFTHVRVANGKLDPAGLNIVRTENDLTGPSAKITYQTPRILGIRAGVSYTPEANMAGVDRDPRRSVPGVLTPELENIVEGSIQISRKLTEQNLRIRASASYATGETSVKSLQMQTDDVEVWNAGLELEFESFSVGGEYLTSNNGVRSSGDYTAWSLGAMTDAYGWEWGLRYGEAEDENVAAKGKNWSIGTATEISQKVRVAVGYQINNIDLGQIALSNPLSGAVDGPQGIVVEVTLSL